MASAVRDSEALNLFISCGLEEKTAQNAVANVKVTANLTAVIHEAGAQNGCDRGLGNLLYTVATRYPPSALLHRRTLVSYIASNQIKSPAQLDAALAHLATLGEDPLVEAELKEKCGVGVEVSEEEIRTAVTHVVEGEKERLLRERYRANAGGLLAKVREILPWADGKVARTELDAQLVALLGEKTAEDMEKPPKKKEKKKPAVEGEGAGAGPAPLVVEDIDPYAQFPNPQDNNKVHTEIFFSGGEVWRPKNSREALEKHLQASGGKVITRFPPEPNGYLHIGHAKAMNVSFGLAKERGGHCYLRFDDTNPEAEKQEYIDHIQEITAWLGWEPFKITHSADYFHQLYHLAVQLIQHGFAYVDHQTAAEVKASRESHTESPWRNRCKEESLRLFEDMRRGLVEEGRATLRMKQDMHNANPNMYDLIAYRIKFTAHPKSGSEWCIYPSYDYTHCIVDSLENVTHSLCTLEFETRRASYFWLLEALHLYLPHVWEYARLNITHAVMSKRKLNRLVTERHVDGWDDPRLLTLAGLRRRGASPAAINAFCRAVGISRSDNLIRTELLDHFLRDDLNRTAPRSMLVLHPLRLVIDNFGDAEVEEVEMRKWPEGMAGTGGMEGSYKAPLSRVVYIEVTDFREVDSKEYFGLAPGKSVMLRYAYPVKCTRVARSSDGAVEAVHVEMDRLKSTKPKGVIHWVGEEAAGKSPLVVEVRLFDKLFSAEVPKDEGPAAPKDGTGEEEVEEEEEEEVEEEAAGKGAKTWLNDLNPQSLKVIPAALAVPSLAAARPGDKFQFERLGYFCVDLDSTPEHIIFNRTVTLKDTSKVALTKATR